MSDATNTNTAKSDAAKCDESDAAMSDATQSNAARGDAAYDEAPEDDVLSWNSRTQTPIMPSGNVGYSTFYEPNLSLSDILTLSDNDFRRIARFHELVIKNDSPRQSVFWANDSPSNLT